jgi:hypothetical protein
MARIRFQFVNANPLATASMEIDKEKRDIQEALHSYADFLDAPAARLTDLIAALRKNSPRIVHISTHGSFFNELMLFDENDKPYGANKITIERLFGRYRGDIRLVVLNACYSRGQAELIYKHIESVIGVDKTIGDEVALQYALNLYRSLRDGIPIREAHDAATDLLLRDKRIAEAQWPQLWTRATGARAIIIPATSDEAASLRGERRRRHEDDRARCGLYLESFTLTKRCDPDGSSTLEYSVDGLRVENTVAVQRIRFRLESAAGLVHDPIMDERADRLSIHWISEPCPAPADFKDVIENARIVRGEFCFAQTLTRQTGPYSFGWSVKVHNMDAVTEWEFNNLYLTDKERRHIDESPLQPPREYIARLVWLPTARLVLRLQLPPNMPELPRLRCFDLTLPAQVQPADVIGDGIVFSMPRARWMSTRVTGDTAVKDSVAPESQPSGNRWEPRPRVEELESENVSHDGEGASEAVIEFPELGWYYALDWRLKNNNFAGKFYRFVTDAEAVRQRLIEHREARLKGKTDSRLMFVQEFVRKLHNKVRERFPKEVDEEIFETSLLSYDAHTRRLVVCEGCTDGGQSSHAPSWSFELPFGMGLAGACFRSGEGVLAYAKRDRLEEGELDTYLPVPGQIEHEYMLALPIDHPEMTRQLAADQDVQRCRQLIGVVTIGSTYGPSKLQEFCVDPPSDKPEYVQWREVVQSFRDDCQRECDALSLFLLGRAPGLARQRAEDQS